MLTKILQSPGDEAKRWLHGRGNCVEGYESINIEWLPPIAMVVSYQQQDESWFAQIASQLMTFEQVQGVCLQKRYLPKSPVESLTGSFDLPQYALESGLKYQLNIGQNQNFGIFLDMKNGRDWVRQHSQDKSVLNLFAYTCGFAVAALAGGARFAVNLDMARSSLNTGRENMRINGLDTKKAKFLAHDLFKSWGKLKKFGPYDMVIADPPNLQVGSFDIERDYPKIIRRLPELVAAGGQALLCLNTPWLGQSFIKELMAEHCPDFEFVEAIARPQACLEQNDDNGLKVLLFQRH
ncbi:class I SAM-dependent methyltransferase [Paraferrimonas sp. SM1919]|uniref:class I SAM-dependent methyltransferase n=1 Tax=Paraferrimonas sp. SM1919 TaxID=2662263 RepID=UPI0013D113FB|nr:class I SAM-dependent methyltransferase [Paraferrimonas sp. SM1919]